MVSICFISAQEIFIVVVFVLIFFGSKRIPEVMRGLGKGIRMFKDATQDIQQDIEDSVKDVKKEIDETKAKIKE